MSQVTQEDIARECSVSRETVTKALQDHPGVAKETKAKVVSMAEKMGYIPNFYASHLVSKHTKTIGVIVPKISHSFHASMVQLIYKYAGIEGYNVVPMISFEEKSNEVRNVRTLLAMRVDGILVNVSQDTPDIDMYLRLQKRGVPVVFFDRLIENEQVCYVAAEDRKASCQVVIYALSKGFRKPAHLAGYSNLSISRERKNGFMDALNKFGIPPNPDWILEGGFSERLGYEHANRLLRSENRPDLIFCFNDSIAHSVYKVAKRRNIDIPGELGVIGYGDLALSRLVKPPLTTVKLAPEAFARHAVRLLLDQLKHSGTIKPEHVFLQPEIVIRESCR